MSKISAKDFFTSRRTSLACATVTAMLGIGLAYNTWIAQPPPQSPADFQSRFAELRALEARWDTEILSVQLGIAPNYDGVTRTARDFQQNLNHLQNNAATDPALIALQPELEGYAAAIRQKARLTEQVKASYAMLRNAATILPDAVAGSLQFEEALQPIVGSSKRPSDLITETITAMMSFAISPTALLQKTVQERISTTEKVAGVLPPRLSEVINRFLSQIEVVTRERQRGNELMLAITAVPSGAAADNIQSKINSIEDSQAATLRSRSELSLLLGVLFIIALASLVFVLWHRFSQLNKDNRVLQQVNENVEEQLMQSAKLSALGQMVAGITHEINTPLAYVRAVFELIKERITSDQEVAIAGEDEEAARDRREELQILLEDGLHGLEEISTLVRTMKNFSRLDKGHIESFSVEEGIESALLIARPQLKYVADVKLEFDTVPPIMGSPSQLRQVLLNLIVNASQAMSSMDRRGLLTLRTRITSSDTVQIDVCDNGPGIPDSIIEKIFDPFFTTKPVGEGTGMGLSICYRIVENHGGIITVNSKPGKGTVFTITLPRQGEKFPQMGNFVDNRNDHSGSVATARLDVAAAHEHEAN